MIRVRDPKGRVETMTLEEFERRARTGEIAPQHEVCFPVVTGERFVRARELELFRGLYTAGTITFRRYFHLGRVPYVTVLVMALLIATYFGWQEGAPSATAELLEEGAKSPVLMLELGDWWRLLTANFLHVSGWHLAVNALFLLNLGGPTEAVFRRTDYIIVLISSALCTTLLSALANPAVSCGASGVVFGVWGAAAVFGMRHRDMLPERYRRYFIGSVIPYSVFALYLGFATEGVDNWGHLGGLLAGCSCAYFMPARLLRPRDNWATFKLLALAAVLLALAAVSLVPRKPQRLADDRYYPRNGLLVAVPERWRMIVSRGTTADGNETYAFENGAGVLVAIETQRESTPVDPSDLVKRFMEDELAAHLETAELQGFRTYEPRSVFLAGLPAKHLRIDLLMASVVNRIDFYLAANGYHRYTLSLSAPSWLHSAYQPTFSTIVAQASVVAPDSELVAP